MRYISNIKQMFIPINTGIFLIYYLIKQFLIHIIVDFMNGFYLCELKCAYREVYGDKNI